MTNRYLALFFILFISKFSLSQENDTLVKQFNIEFPKSDLVITKLEQNIELVYNKTNKTFEVNEEINYHLLSLKPLIKVEIPVFFDNNTDIITTKISKGKLLKTIGNYHPEGIFHSDLKLCLLQLDISKSGETKILSIKKKHQNIEYYTSIPFGTIHYPVKYSYVKIIAPQNFDVDFIQSNTENFGYKMEKYLPVDDKMIYTFSCANIPSYQEEKEKPPLSYYSPKLFIIPKSYKFNNEEITFFKDLEHLYKWCKDKIDRTQNDTLKIKPIVKQITEGKNTDIGKIKGIYNWVQDNIRYIAFEEGLAGYIPDNAQNVLYNKYGDCKGMANLLKSMFIIAGFDARIGWIGTKDIKENFSIHNLGTSNHVICVLFYNKQKYFLDATDKFSYFGNNPENICGKQILIENGTTYILDTIPLTNITQSKAETKASYKIQNQEMNGNVSISFQGDIRSYMLHKLTFSDVEEKNKVLEKIITRASPKIMVKNISHSGIVNTDSIFKITADINIKGLLTKIDNQLYLTPDLFEEITDLTAPENKKLSQYFNYRQHRKFNSKIEVPRDYTIQKIPENFHFKNDYITLTVTYISQNNTIEYQKEWILHSNIIPNHQITKWNNDLKTIKKVISQPVILIKP